MEKMRFQVSAECCERFTRTDVRGETNVEQVVPALGVIGTHRTVLQWTHREETIVEQVVPALGVIGTHRTVSQWTHRVAGDQLAFCIQVVSYTSPADLSACHAQPDDVLAETHF